MTTSDMPHRDKSPDKTGTAVPFALSLVCGYVDAFGLTLFMAFLSFMSGNTTYVGIGLGSGDIRSVLAPLAAIVGFCVGAFAGTALHAGRPVGHRRGLAFAALLLGLAYAALLLDTGLPYAVLLLGAASMGIVNAIWRQIGNQDVNVAFVTGALFALCSHLAQAATHQPLRDRTGPGDTHLWRARLLAAQVMLFLTGAVAGAWVTSRIGEHALLPPLGVLLILAVWQRPFALARH